MGDEIKMGGGTMPPPLTFENLEQVANRYNTTRDALVEFSIERILPLIKQEKEKHGKRKIILQDLQKFFKEGAEMLKMMRHVNGCREEVENLVEKGNRIESF